MGIMGRIDLSDTLARQQRATSIAICGSRGRLINCKQKLVGGELFGTHPHSVHVDGNKGVVNCPGAPSVSSSSAATLEGHRCCWLLSHPSFCSCAKSGFLAHRRCWNLLCTRMFALPRSAGVHQQNHETTETLKLKGGTFLIGANFLRIGTALGPRRYFGIVGNGKLHVLDIAAPGRVH